MLNQDVIRIIFNYIKSHNDQVSFMDTCKLTRMTLIEFYKIPTDEQLNFLKLFDEGKNIILCSAAGCGKTFCVNFLRRKRSFGCVFSASTGTAANLIEGCTIDSFITKLKHIKSLNEELERLKTVVIDEVSMMGHTRFLEMDIILRKWYNRKKPFGGLQIVLVGDFLQLPAIQDTCLLYSPYMRFFNFSFVYLKTMKRQKDEHFIKILNYIRVGIVNKNVSDLIHELEDTEFIDDGILPTILVGTNKEANEYNLERLKKLEDNERTFLSKVDFSQGFYGEVSFKLPTENIILKIGAQVMLLVNLDVKTGLTNGAQGIVLQFVNGLPLVKFTNGKIKVIGEYTEIIKKRKLANGDLSLDNLIDNAETMEDLHKPQYEYARHIRIPLRLSWASTVHKLQGKTIERGIIDCSKIRVAGHFYVALSRFPNKKNVKIINFNDKCIVADNTLILQLHSFYKGLPQYKMCPPIPNYEIRVGILKNREVLLDGM